MLKVLEMRMSDCQAWTTESLWFTLRLTVLYLVYP